MNRALIPGIALAAGFVVASQSFEVLPWSWGATWAPLAAALTVALVLRGLRDAHAPREARLGGVRRTGAIAVGIVIGFLLLPRWGLVASYRGDAFRMELIAMAFVVFAGLMLLVFATEEARE